MLWYVDVSNQTRIKYYIQLGLNNENNNFVP